MTQEQESAPLPSSTERAEQLLTRAGERLGRVAGKAILGARQATRHLREEADQMDMPGAASEHSGDGAEVEGDQQPRRPATERAEKLVEQMVRRVSRWTVTNDVRVRRAVARLREDAEDVWVEARHMRGTWKNKNEQK